MEAVVEEDMDAVDVVAVVLVAAAAAAAVAAINGEENAPLPPIEGNTIRAVAYLVKFSMCTEPMTNVNNTKDPA